MKKIIILLFLILSPLQLSASVMDNFTDTGKSSGFDTENTNENTMSEIVGLVINAFLSLLGIIFVSLIVYGGYLWMSDAGNSDKIERARKLITAAIIGLIITASAWTIWQYVFDSLLNS